MYFKFSAFFVLCSTDSISASCSYYATVREKIMLYSLISSMQLRIIIVVWLGAHQQLKEKTLKSVLILVHLHYVLNICYTLLAYILKSWCFTSQCFLCYVYEYFLSFMHSLHSLIRYITWTFVCALVYTHFLCF